MHGDWRVACAQQDGKTVCVFSQQQTNKDTGQLLLAIELRALLTDWAQGTLVLPFGLAVQRPITLEINDAPIGTPLNVRTCLPVGCLVNVSLDAAMIASLKKAQSLIGTRDRRRRSGCPVHHIAQRLFERARSRVRSQPVGTYSRVESLVHSHAITDG